MISINNFTHRLGNQLFQIAAAYSYAKEHNMEFYLPKEWQYQKYFVLKHKIGNIHSECIWREPGFHYTKIPSFLTSVSIEGYFQSKKYFDNIDINKLFTFETCISDRKISSHICFIHIRRGDYLNLPEHHPLCTMDYYIKAIEESGYNSFVIYSDDIEWCKKEFGILFNTKFKDKWIFYSSEKDIEDFYEMSQYKAGIISNSTFSWWAAMLNPLNHSEKRIISPSKNNWHGPAYSHFNHDDLIPDNWIQISF